MFEELRSCLVARIVPYTFGVENKSLNKSILEYISGADQE